MKKVFFIVTLFISTCSFAQTTTLTVLKQTSAPDSMYTFTPGNLFMTPLNFTANADSLFVKFELNYTNGFDISILAIILSVLF